jgi:tRNA(adenine34) deaminase
MKNHKNRSDEYFMAQALKEASRAGVLGEVPIGAVVVRAGKIIARAHNRTITDNDPTAHAEILALRKAAKKSGYYRLTECKLFVTIEPCPMCAGAMIWARVKEVIYGAADVKAGACGTLFDITNDNRLNHKCKVRSGVLEKECREMIQEFFIERRKKKKEERRKK